MQKKKPFHLTDEEYEHLSHVRDVSHYQSTDPEMLLRLKNAGYLEQVLGGHAVTNLGIHALNQYEVFGEVK